MLQARLLFRGAGAACRTVASCGRTYAAAASSPATAEPRARGFLGALLVAGAAGGAALALSPQRAEANAAAGAAPAAAEPKERDLYDRWASIKAFLGSWQKGAPTEAALPADKLKCHLPPGGYNQERYHPVVLVSCGSFNPPTFMHLRMLELAQQAMAQAGFDVLGCYMSPVNDAYWKQALAPGRHRVRMCQLAAADSESIMVDPWEVEQRQYTRTLHVLQHVQQGLGALFSAGQAPTPAEPGAGASCPPVSPRVLLVCGADVLHSMADPTMWRQDLLEKLLAEHGVVCVSRTGADAARLLDAPGSLLQRYRQNVTVVEEPVPNEISSSRVRHELERGHSVRYLLPDSVASYIYAHRLYNTSERRPRILHLGEQKVDRDTDM
ncbi:nicotinamide mononucleotide adenylyltransferase [Micractinium conductrix]|uniref:Nicotinamide-nucleotide adenylyltransferase n=1 Tax=Micractinium conductrix TaxID=554055 RepID=A0A2P6VIG0_9CHLO|nr:nicotinamide mononucleotide adenylyltransferase [Micractinium conductrix]|eukprot:PSC73874.1 nicotinamide mononucleotide adenylyltransferase [Micractinium conductrix]